MELSVSHQFFVFVCMFLCGGATGVIFDIFRAFRRCIKSGSGIIAAQDLLLWFAELVIVYYTAFKVNNAELRGYEAIALFAGAFVYFIVFSEYAVKLVCRVIAFLLKILSLVARPLKSICVILVKPFKKILLYTKGKWVLLKNTLKSLNLQINLRIKTALSEKKHKI